MHDAKGALPSPSNPRHPLHRTRVKVCFVCFFYRFSQRSLNSYQHFSLCVFFSFPFLILISNPTVSTFAKISPWDCTGAQGVAHRRRDAELPALDAGQRVGLYTTSLLIHCRKQWRGNLNLHFTTGQVRRLWSQILFGITRPKNMHFLCTQEM